VFVENNLNKQQSTVQSYKAIEKPKFGISELAQAGAIHFQ